jgi:2-keto-4-pentenoate hydratase/2-oxohepta-3-ene-1,7-dioic acid hydratase in catechol pathway
MTPDPAGTLSVAARVGAIVGADGAVGAYTVFAEWRDERRTAPKDRDFALGLGPVAVTADEFDPAAGANVVRVDGEERVRSSAPELDWTSAIALAADGTRLYPGDVVAGPTHGVVGDIRAGAVVEVEVVGIGVLTQRAGQVPAVRS